MTWPPQGERFSPPPLVSLEDLHQIQRHLLRHLTDCRDCAIEEHLYCHQAERTGRIRRLPDEIPDAGAHPCRLCGRGHSGAYSGITGGIHGTGCTDPPDREETGRETAGRPVYGIDGRPAEQAFRESLHRCTFLLSEIGEVLRGRPGASPAGDDGNPAIVGHVEHYARVRAYCSQYSPVNPHGFGTCTHARNALLVRLTKTDGTINSQSEGTLA